MLRLDSLKTEIQAQLKVSIAQQLIFSPCTPHSITPHSHPSPEQFSQLMEKCGASRGNGVLYLLPINSVQGNDGAPDSSCLAELRELSCMREEGVLKYIHVENAPWNLRITSVSNTVYCRAWYWNQALHTPIHLVLTWLKFVAVLMDMQVIHNPIHFVWHIL